MRRCRHGINDIQFTDPKEQARFNHILRQTGGDKDLALQVYMDSGAYESVDRSTERGWTPKIQPKQSDGLPDFSMGETQANLNEYLSFYSIPGFTPSQQTEILSSMLWQISQFDFTKVNPPEAFEKVRKDFIAKAKRAEDNGETYLLDEIVKILDNWPLFVDKSIDNLRSIGYNVKGVNDWATVDTDTIGEIGDVVWEGEDSNFEKIKFDADARFQQDTRVTSSARLKMFLSVIPAVSPEFNKDGVPVGEPNYLGWPKIAEFDIVWDQMKALLANHNVRTMSEVLDILGAQSNPIFTVLAKRIADAPVDIQSQVISAMAQEHITMQLVTYKNSTVKDGESSGVDVKPINSNRNSQIDTIVLDWVENQKLLPITVRIDGNRTIDREIISEIQDRYGQIYNEFKRIEGGLRSTDFLDALGGILSEIGITLNQSAIDSLADSSSKVFSGSFEAAMNPGSKNQFISAIFGAFHNTADVEESDDIAAFELNNPLTGMQSQGFIRRLAAHSAQHDSRSYPADFRNIDGKTIYSYQNFHHLSSSFYRFKSDESYRNMRTSISFGADSMWAKLLIAKPGLEAVLNLEYVDGLKQDNSFRGQLRKEMGVIDQHFLALGYFQGPQRNSIRGHKLAKFMAPTLSDSTVTPIFSFVKQEVTSDIEDGRVSGLSNIDMSNLLSVARAEIGRISRFQAQVKDKLKEDGVFATYAKGAEFFYLMPYLNIDHLKQLVEEGIITDSEMAQIWVEGKLIVDSKSAASNGALRKVISHEVLKEISTLQDTWKDGGLVTVNDKGETITNMSSEYLRDLGQDNMEDRVAFAAADYHLNYIYFYAEFARLFGGDPAHAFKKDVATTLINVQKRLGSAASPIISGNWDVGDTYTKVTLADRVIKSKDAALYRARLGISDYDTINSTDAQEFTTLAEHVRVLEAYGIIDPGVASAIKRKIKKGKNYRLTVKELSAVKRPLRMRPSKPLAYVVNPELDYDMINAVLTKSSSIPLIPQIIEGLELDKLRVAMEEQGIDRAAHESADKLGIKHIQAIYKGSSIKDGIIFENVQTLSRNGFGIQQAVPEKRPLVLTLSQMNKNFLVGITNETGFEFMGNTNLTAQDIKRTKEGLRIEMIRRSKESLFNRLEIVETEIAPVDGKVETILTFGNLPKLRDAVIEEAKRRKWSQVDIEKLELTDDENEFIQPFDFGNSSDAIQSLLFSMVNNEITKQKLFGIGYVQASSSGWVATGDKTGVIFSSDYDPAKGLRSLREDKDGNILPAQIIVPWYFRDRDGFLLPMNSYVDENGRIDNELISKEVLRLIGARIPHQGPSSQLPFEIVGFMPPIMDALAIVPDEITTQMDSDFDFDKLYTYLTQYRVDDGGVISKLQPQIGDVEEQIIPEEAIPGDEAVEDLLDTILPIPQEDGDVVKEVEADIDKGDLAMKPDNIEKIISGTKTTTLRTKKLDAGIYTLPTGIKVKITHIGFGNVDELGGVTVITESEDFADDGPKFDSTKAFLSGNKKLHLHTIEVQDVQKNLEEGETGSDDSGQVGLEAQGDDSGDTDRETTGQETQTRRATVSELKQAYMDIMWSVMTHRTALKRMMRPLANNDLITETELIAKAQGIDKTVVSPLSIDGQLRDNVKQNSGNQLISSFSSLSKFSAVIEDSDLRFVNKAGESFGVSFYNDDGSSVFLNRLSTGSGGIATSEYSGEERTAQIDITSLANAALDNPSENLLGRLNFNSITVPAINVMVQGQTDGGDRLNLSHITRLMGQESIRFYVERVQFGMGALSNLSPRAAKLRAYEETLEFIRNRHFDAREEDTFKPISPKDIRSVRLTPKYLLSQMRKGEIDPTSRAYTMGQLAALEKFQFLLTISEQMSAISNAVLFADKNGGGRDMITNHEQIGRVNDLSDVKLIAGGPELLGKFNSHGEFIEAQTELGHMTMESMFLSWKLFSSTFSFISSPTYTQSVDMISDIAGRQLFSDERRRIWKGVRSFIYSDLSEIFGDPNAARQRLLMGEDSLAHQLRDLKETAPWARKNFFLSQLQTNISLSENEPSTIRYMGSKAERINETRTVEHFAALMRSSDPDQRALAKDLVHYAFLTGGIQNATSFVKHIPTGYLEFLGFNGALRGYELFNRVQPIDFVEQYIQNNPRVAPQITKKDIGKRALPSTFNWESSPAGGPHWNTDTESYPEYLAVPLKKRRYRLYKNLGMMDDGRTHFEEIHTRGDAKAGISEYGPGVGIPLFAVNKPKVMKARPVALPPVIPVAKFEDETGNKEPTVAAHYFQAAITNNKDKLVFAVSQMQNEAFKEIGDIIVAAKDLLGDDYKLEFTNKLTSPRFGAFHVADNRVQISTDIRSRDRFESTFIHENLHALTVSTVKAFQNGESLTPGVKPIMESLERTFKRARAEFENVPEFKSFLEKVEKARNDDNLNIVFSSIEASLYYPLLNLDEFITGTMVNSGFQRLLNQLPADEEGKTMLDVFTELITSLLETIGRTFGIEINEDSALEQSVGDIIRLLSSLSAFPEPALQSDVSLSINIPDAVDNFMYFGKKYQIELSTGQGGTSFPVRVIGYQGTREKENKILDAYRDNPDLDPQRKDNKPFRNTSPVSDDHLDQFRPQEERKSVFKTVQPESLDDLDFDLEEGSLVKKDLATHTFQFNTQQKEALDKLDTFLKSSGPDIFVLQGRGGTGKTTILREALRRFDPYNDKKIAGATISHKAKNVLGISIGRNNAMTVAKLMGITLNEKTGTFTVNEFLRSRGVPIQDADIIIIDETSQIGPNLMEEMLSMKKRGAKIIFVGDNVQHHPIGDGHKDESPTFKAHKGPDNHAELLIRERQGEASPILGVTDIIAANVESAVPQVRVLNDTSDRVSQFNPVRNEGVIFSNSGKQVINMMVADLLEAGENPEHTKAIVFNNERFAGSPQSVLNLNKTIRNFLWGEDAKNLYNKGEHLVAYDNWARDKREEPIVYNSEAYVLVSQKTAGKRPVDITDKQGRNFKSTYNHLLLTMRDSQGRVVTVPVVTAEDRVRFERDVSELASKKKWSLMFKLRETFANLHYGYAITSHKAQGSTYRNAYVFEDNLLGATAPGTAKIKNTGLYVAVSRPSHKLVMHSKQNPDFDEGADVSFSLGTPDGDLGTDVGSFMKSLNKEDRATFRSLRADGKLFTKCD